MSTKFEIIYPGKSRIGFDGGINLKYDRQLITDNETPDCLNVIYGNGSVETRPGSTKLNTATAGTFACDGLYTRHTFTGAESMCAWFGGTMYVLGTTTFTAVASATSVWTAGVRVAATEMENYLFMGNGGSIPMKYNGEFTRHGVYPPTATAAAATAATGSVLTGTYRYAYTYVNTALVESDLSPLTATFTAASENIELTGIGVAPQSFGVNARYLYRTANSSAVFKRLATLSNNTATVYTDAIADAALGIVAPTDKGVPPNYNVCVTHQSRLFFIDPSSAFVWYTDLGEPYTVASTNFRVMGDSTSDIPKSLFVYENGIVVGCAKSVWFIYMPSSSDADWLDIRIKTSYGSKSPFGGFTFNNRLMLPVMESDKFVGFAAIAGTSVEPTATILTVQNTLAQLYSDKIEPDMDDVPVAYVPNISAIVYRNRAFVALPYGAVSKNNRIYYFDFSMENLSKNQKFAWAPWTGMNVSQMCIYGGMLYYGTSDATGFVYRMMVDNTFSDDGSAINSYYWTKEYDGGPGYESFWKDWRYINILYEASGEYNMTLSHRMNSAEDEGQSVDVDLTPDAALWGTMVWGTDMWSAGYETKELDHAIGSGGRRIQLKFSNQNTAGQKFKLVGMQLRYNLRGRR